MNKSRSTSGIILHLFLKMKNILVTGANGFVGYYLVKRLLQHNQPVVATGKGENRLPFTGEGFTYVFADLTSEQEVTNLMDSCQPIVVIHLAAISKPDECELNKSTAFSNNVEATQHLLKASAKSSAHFIFLSTDFVFKGDKGFYKEDDRREPVNYYGETKLLAENAVMNYEHKWSIVRTVLVYGRSYSGRENIVTMTANALKENKPLKIFTDQLRTPTYVEDLANAIVLIMAKQATGIYHISGRDVLTPYEVSIQTAAYLDLDTNLVSPVTEEEFDQPAKRPAKTGFDISKAEMELGFVPVSFEEGIRKTFASPS